MKKKTGEARSLEITPAVYARLAGPYNRRNVYGAVLAYGPLLSTDPNTKPLFDSVARYSLCGPAPLLRELGIAPGEIDRGLRIRLEPRPGTDVGSLPMIIGSTMPVKNGWTGGQYSLFRALFAAYLLVHFIGLVPWSRELFSNEGALADGATSPLLYLFPNILAFHDGPWLVAVPLIAAAAASLCFAVGFYDRAAALLQWYVLACLFGRNPLIANPALPFVGWMLLAHVFLPKGPFGSLAARGRSDPRGGWHMPQAIYGAAWIVMALAYSYSGYTKLVSPSWVDGSALSRVLENPLARPTFLREISLTLPPVFFKTRHMERPCSRIILCPPGAFPPPPTLDLDRHGDATSGSSCPRRFRRSHFRHALPPLFHFRSGMDPAESGGWESYNLLR